MGYFNFLFLHSSCSVVLFLIFAIKFGRSIIVFFFFFFQRKNQRVRFWYLSLPGGSQKITELVLSFHVYEGVRTLYV